MPPVPAYSKGRRPVQYATESPHGPRCLKLTELLLMKLDLGQSASRSFIRISAPLPRATSRRPVASAGQTPMRTLKQSSQTNSPWSLMERTVDVVTKECALVFFAIEALMRSVAHEWDRSKYVTVHRFKWCTIVGTHAGRSRYHDFKELR